MTTMDIQWLAGYLEGEGCFRLNGGTAAYRSYIPSITVATRKKPSAAFVVSPCLEMAVGSR